MGQGSGGINRTLDSSYIPSKYSKAYNLYSRNQINSVLPFVLSISRICPFSSLYPIFKLLKATCKMLMLNEMEVVLLGFLIKQTKWEINEVTIWHNAENVQDIIYCSIDHLDYKRIILYLMLTAFTVKFYLNPNTQEIVEEVNKKCPNFKQIFQGWNKKHSSIVTKINPRSLNLVYNQLYGGLEESHKDFNVIVDAIIQISPAYNPEKGQEIKKRREKSELSIKKTIVDPNLFALPQPSLFSSSILLNLANRHQTQPQKQSGFNLFMPCKSDRMRAEYRGILGSSVVNGLNR